MLSRTQHGAAALTTSKVIIHCAIFVLNTCNSNTCGWRCLHETVAVGMWRIWTAQDPALRVRSHACIVSVNTLLDLQLHSWAVAFQVAPGTQAQEMVSPALMHCPVENRTPAQRWPPKRRQGNMPGSTQKHSNTIGLSEGNHTDTYCTAGGLFKESTCVLETHALNCMMKAQVYSVEATTQTSSLP